MKMNDKIEISALKAALIRYNAEATADIIVALKDALIECDVGGPRLIELLDTMYYHISDIWDECNNLFKERE